MALRSVRAAGYYWRWERGAVLILESKDGDVARDVQRRAYAVQKRMKRRAGYRYGTLRRGIRVESVRESPTGPKAAVISTAQHTMVHERGRKAIVRGPGPGVGTYAQDSLKFQPVRGARSIFRFRVDAAKGTKFMESSVDAALD